MDGVPAVHLQVFLRRVGHHERAAAFEIYIAAAIGAEQAVYLCRLLNLDAHCHVDVLWLAFLHLLHVQRVVEIYELHEVGQLVVGRQG